jgi:hypothetical protein
MSTQQIDPFTYMRIPRLDVAAALGLGKMLVHRVPSGPTPPVRKAVSLVEKAIADLEQQWLEQREQELPTAKSGVRPVARRLDSAWVSIRTRLVAYESLPEGHKKRVRAQQLHDLLFPDGLEFLKLAFVRKHGESELRLQLLESRGVEKQLEALVGEEFVADLRAIHEAYGDALGINKASPEVPQTVIVADHLRALVDAISGYALQLVAVARHDPDKRAAVISALAPIETFRLAAGRRIVADDEEEREEEEVELAANAPQPQPTGTD